MLAALTKLRAMFGLAAQIPLRWAAPVLVAGFASPCLPALCAQPPVPNSAVRALTTVQRLDQAAMARILGPIGQALTEGRHVEARTALDRELSVLARRHGESSLQVADLLTAFAITTFTVDAAEGERRAALMLLERALRIYRAQFGPDHLEVALVAADVGNAGLALDSDGPSTTVVAALEEAYRIRRAALGPRHAETAASLASLARARGLPIQTSGMAARIDAAAAMFREAISAIGDAQLSPASSAAALRLDLADMYARNGRLVAAATEAGLAFQGGPPASDHPAACGILSLRALRVIERLESAGGIAEALQVGEAMRAACGDRFGLLERLAKELAAGRRAQEGADRPER